jgi:hypothetical protein
MEDQTSYNGRRVSKPRQEELIQAISRIREIGEVTRQCLILDEDRKGIANDPKNQALLEQCLQSMMRITDLYFA